MRNPLAFTWQVVAGAAVLVILGIGVARYAWSEGDGNTLRGKGIQFSCDFERSPTDCGFEEQAKIPGRATLTDIARSGKHGVRLHTLPTDTHVNGSDDWARNDLSLDPRITDCSEGKEAWWAHSVYFPEDFQIPPEGGTFMDFHHMGSGGNANFHFNVTDRGYIRMHAFGGDARNPIDKKVDIEPVKRNQWYDMVYHIRWTSTNNGLIDGWINGRKVYNYRGPTLYRGMTCYLKLANYHGAKQPSSVIHDRVIRGTSAAAVSLTPLEGVGD